MYEENYRKCKFTDGGFFVVGWCWLRAAAVKADVPFEFSVGKKTFPAGEYSGCIDWEPPFCKPAGHKNRSSIFVRDRSR